MCEGSFSERIRDTHGGDELREEPTSGRARQLVVHHVMVQLAMGTKLSDEVPGSPFGQS
jgi:hypothetical protein